MCPRRRCNARLNGPLNGCAAAAPLQELSVDLSNCDPDCGAPLLSLAACLAAGLAAVEVRRAELGLAGVQAVVACAGCGAGEYACAVFAGALRLQDALKLVRAHAAALEEGADTEGFSLLPLSGLLDSASNLAEEGGLVAEPPGLVAPPRQAAAAAAAAAAVRAGLGGMSLRDPRITVFCGASGLPYGNAAALREALPRAACTGPPPVAHLQQLCLAMEQQGCGELADALGDDLGVSD